jgi:hypothetical protein
MNNITNTTNINIKNSIMLFTGGIFDGKKIRLNNKYLSIFDIISVAGGQKADASRKIWERISKNYPDEVVTLCHNFKFPGAGQRETPCVDVNGLVKLLMWIPGKKAQEFRNLTANTMVRYLGGDTSLATEIQNINNKHTQNGCEDIFRQAIPKKITYDESYYLYVRVYNKFFEQQQKDFECNNIRLSFDIIKFGIAKSIQNRESGYGNDYGFFQYAVKVKNKECATSIEKILRQEFKDITIENSYEYLHSKKLAKLYNIIKHDNCEIFEKKAYYKTAEILYTKILKEYHLQFPEELDNFGLMYHPKKEQDDDDNIKINCVEIQLSKEHLKEYILPYNLDSNENNNIQTSINEISNEEINEITQEENKFLKTCLNKLETIVEEKNPELLTEYKKDKEKSESHKKNWAKHKVYQYNLDGKFIKIFNTVSAAAKTYECSTKIIRTSIQHNKSFCGFLWKSSKDVQNTSDLQMKKIEKCDPDDYKILKTYNSFNEVNIDYSRNENFILNEVYRAIDLGFVYYGFRWKFVGDHLKLGNETGRTGMKKRVKKLNDNYETVDEYPSLLKASKSIKMSKSSLSMSIKYNKKLVGFYWKYIV